MDSSKKEGYKRNRPQHQVYDDFWAHKVGLQLKKDGVDLTKSRMSKADKIKLKNDNSSRKKVTNLIQIFFKNLLTHKLQIIL